MILLSLGMLLFAVILFVLHIILCVWAYRDCMERNRSQEYALIVLLLLFFFPIAGLIVYLLIRDH
jgi:CDP-diglyceride synthetase